MKRAVFALVLACWLGCGGEAERRRLGPTLPPGQTDAGTSRYVPVPESAAPLGSYSAPSELLGCGRPCADTGVSPAGSCREQVAVRCVDDVTVCDACGETGASCVDEGGSARCLRGCAGTGICPAQSACFEQACCPLERWCERGAQVICDDTGQYMDTQPCLTGLDCVDGQCVPARSLVHVLFDTSNSMNWVPSVDGQLPPAFVVKYPACDAAEAPMSRLGIAKAAFRNLFSLPTYDHVYFGLQRFPQRLDPLLSPICFNGAYRSVDVITGHSGVPYLIADDSGGDWFIQNLGEAFVVPFPKEVGETGREALLSWMDFDERSTLTETPCTSHSQCAQGICADPGDGDGGVCRTLDDPELRALGWTPLGTSLFYAGEYLRKLVIVDGKSCQIDVDCRSPFYFCVDGTCQDPNRFCRQRSIVVFTDGADTSSLGQWMEPVVQARRLRSGMDCTEDVDCGVGFECAIGGTCQPPGTGLSHNPCQALGTTCTYDERAFPDAVALGADRLRDRLGRVIHLTIHVVDGSGSANVDAAAVAAYGGGLLVPADMAEPTALLDGIRGIIDWKDAPFCDEMGR